MGTSQPFPSDCGPAVSTEPAYWLIGFMVHPEHRNGPIGFLLLKQAVRDLEITLSLTVQQTTIRLLTAVGFRELGTCPTTFGRSVRVAYCQGSIRKPSG